ncbi:MAG: gluconolactonase [Rhodospirillaceae bacterium]|nr:gluconolactonase [Rhodospirillaceae bacterium]
MISLSKDDFSFIGTDLIRPECVVATKKGDLFASHAGKQGGIVKLANNGGQEFILAKHGDIPEGFVPNGFALLPDGSFLIANVGDQGGVYNLKRDGTLIPFLLEIEGKILPACNFVYRDEQERIWISVSTWAKNRDESFKKDVADGFVILVDGRGSRIVADDIGFANETKLDPSGRWLYVNETMGRSICRYPINDKGNLGLRETYADYDVGIFPDGFDFDRKGGIWCTSVVSNRLVRIDPDGSQISVFVGGDLDVVNRAEKAYQNDVYTRDHLVAGNKSILGNCASIGFGGPDLKTGFIGSLASNKIVTFRSPIAGVVPPHWNF